MRPFLVSYFTSPVCNVVVHDVQYTHVPTTGTEEVNKHNKQTKQARNNNRYYKNDNQL